MKTYYVLYSIQANLFLKEDSRLTKNWSDAIQFKNKQECIDYLKVNSRIIKNKTESKFWTTREFFML